MKKSAIIIAILAVVIIIAISLGGSYNGIVAKAEEVDNKFATIDTQLQRRADLIPNLVNTVKGYAAQEKEIIASVTEARAKLAGAKTVGEKANADEELTSALNRLLVVVENYPELKANENFSQLQEELQNTENKIAFSRQFYNDVATKYNTKLEVVPSNIIASMFHFEAVELFEAESQEARKNVKVDFNK